MDKEAIRRILEEKFYVALPAGEIVIKGGQIFFFTGERMNFPDADYGLNIGTFDGEDLKPTIDLCQYSRRSFLDVDEREAMQWMCGLDLKKKREGDYVILRYGRYVLGAGKARGERILNFLPKNRRLPLKLSR
ncbi:MAG: hypothetical protein JXB14_02265 [Candidatus Altiarchaeota archaeon]|nr:hypothetical protein [Candidatus Altiarchaeota archaeon]